MTLLSEGSLPATLLIGFVVTLIGLSKGGLGGAAGAAATPLLALIYPVDQVVAMLLPLLMTADVFAVAAHWRRWENRLLWLLVPASLIGITAGTYFISSLSPLALRRALGLLVLLFVIWRLGERWIEARLPYRARPWHGILAGATAGFTSTLAHSGGPPIAAYLLLQKITPRAFVATTALYFGIINWLKVPYYLYIDILQFERIVPLLAFLPLMPIGVLAGRILAERIERETFARIILFLLIGSAILLLTS